MDPGVPAWPERERCSQLLPSGALSTLLPISHGTQPVGSSGFAWILLSSFGAVVCRGLGSSGQALVSLHSSCGYPQLWDSGSGQSSKPSQDRSFSPRCGCNWAAPWPQAARQTRSLPPGTVPCCIKHVSPSRTLHLPSCLANWWD